MKSRLEKANESTPLINNRDMVLIEVQNPNSANPANLATMPIDVISTITSNLALGDVFKLAMVNKALFHKVNKASRLLKVNVDGHNQPRAVTYKYIFDSLKENDTELKQSQNRKYTLRFKILQNISLGYVIVSGFGEGALLLGMLATGSIPAIIGVSIGLPLSGMGAFALYRYSRNKVAQWEYKQQVMQNVRQQPERIMDRKDQLAVNIEAPSDGLEPDPSDAGYYY